MVALYQQPQQRRSTMLRHFSNATTATTRSTTAFLLFFVSLSLMMIDVHGCRCGLHQSLSKALSEIPNEGIGKDEDGDRVSILLVRVEGEVRTRKNENFWKEHIYTNVTVLRDYQDCGSGNTNGSHNSYHKIELLNNESSTKVEKSSTMFVKTSNSPAMCGQPLIEGRSYLLFGKRRYRRKQFIPKVRVEAFFDDDDDYSENEDKDDLPQKVTILKTHSCYNNRIVEYLTEDQLDMLENKHKKTCPSLAPERSGRVETYSSSSSSLPSFCSLPSETGMCRAEVPKWFYNYKTMRCEQFTYGGCGGNDNRFGSQNECQNACMISFSSASSESNNDNNTKIFVKPPPPPDCQSRGITSGTPCQTGEESCEQHGDCCGNQVTTSVCTCQEPQGMFLCMELSCPSADHCPGQ